MKTKLGSFLFIGGAVLAAFFAGKADFNITKSVVADNSTSQSSIDSVIGARKQPTTVSSTSEYELHLSPSNQSAAQPKLHFVSDRQQAVKISASVEQQTGKKPNILVIWGDDIGYDNISAYNLGMMGYRTPNIDRLAREGALFTDFYAEQTCTAGRSAFILGQHPFRTGLLTIGMPGSDHGIPDWAPTMGDVFKEQGYATAQYGKNHLGDRDKHLPTVHGFDEFFGNLYHLNAEEEPEGYYYPKDPEFKEKYGPRGVIKSNANGTIEDTGALTRKRMETVDEEFLASALDFIDRSVKADKPFFTWFNASRMHVWTHLKT